MKNGFIVYSAKFSFWVLAMLISVFLVFFTGYAEPIFLDEAPNTAIKFPISRHHSDIDVIIIIPPRAIRPEFDRILGSDYGIAEATLQAADAIMERRTPRVPTGVFLPNPRRLNIPDLLSYRSDVDSWRSLDRLLHRQLYELYAKRRRLSKRQLDVCSPLSYRDNSFQGRLFMDSARKGVGCGYVIGDPYALAYMFADTIGLQKDGTEKIKIEWLLTAPSKIFASVLSGEVHSHTASTTCD